MSRLPQETIDEVISMYGSGGYRTIEIAKTLYLDRSTVNKILRAYHVVRWPHRWSHRHRLAVELYVEHGYSLHKAGVMAGMSYNSVRNALITQNIKRRPRKGSTFQKLPNREFDRVRDLYEQGFNLAQIGRLIDRNPNSVRWRLQRAGVPLRSRSEIFKTQWQLRRAIEARDSQSESSTESRQLHLV